MRAGGVHRSERPETQAAQPVSRSDGPARHHRAADPVMLGPHHLNEVFLDGVEVFADEVLGEVGDGWRVMREALAFERVGIAR